MTSIRHNTGKATAVIPEDELLDAAREAILAVGWSRTTLTDIARRAGVSRMTLYRKWPDMGALLADLMTREWSTSIGGALAPRKGDALEQLVGHLVATIRAVRANELLGRIIDVDPEILLPYLTTRRGRSQELVIDLLTAEITTGQRTGVIRRGRPDLLAKSVVLAAHGFTLSAHTMLEGTQDRAADVHTLDAELATMIERYLRA